MVNTVATDYRLDSLLKQLWTLRSFPEGIRNCYKIPVKIGTKYLIRASFLYANYDGKNSVPQFDLYFGPNIWITVNLPKEQTIDHEEIIHTTTSNEVQICLVNIGNGVPFISSIELRPLPNTTYVAASGSFTTFLRLDVGVPNDTYIRSVLHYLHTHSFLYFLGFLKYLLCFNVAIFCSVKIPFLKFLMEIET